MISSIPDKIMWGWNSFCFPLVWMHVYGSITSALISMILSMTVCFGAVLEYSFPSHSSKWYKAFRGSYIKRLKEIFSWLMLILYVNQRLNRIVWKKYWKNKKDDKHIEWTTLLATAFVYAIISTISYKRKRLLWRIVCFLGR